ncbi:MAG: Rrf2 family transcriptional regulator [Acidimicrobiia bacterium]|nr:Rrf2 family transcriptional regulator [Acidimicrobiia bacterium]MYC56994.1 Rrf2 family transcriptional regulator [Acidimicrobiia bacterium]MYG94074.1 Rrf2 family transcriptional regulator [Acidimicrobiia bacterium]MYI30859.1 Rrf2 family transcriptional regulator [Acidimicrobiia bacterium]
MRVSTRGDYASRALLSLALHPEDSGPTSVRDIAERTGLPQPYLEQILQALKGAGLVRSKRGANGGYTLARPAEDIRLSEIVSAVDGPISLGDFKEPHQGGSCEHEGQCVLLAIWLHVGDKLNEFLDAYTLADIAKASQGLLPWPGTN